MKIYMPIPQPETYWGIEVKKNTKLEFENPFVKQRLENLTLYTEQFIERETYKTHVETELYLKEGEILLLEEDGRGYFKPSEVKFGTMSEVKKELKFIESQIKKCKE